METRTHHRRGQGESCHIGLEDQYSFSLIRDTEYNAQCIKTKWEQASHQTKRSRGQKDTYKKKQKQNCNPFHNSKHPTECEIVRITESSLKVIRAKVERTSSRTAAQPMSPRTVNSGKYQQRQHCTLNHTVPYSARISDNSDREILPHSDLGIPMSLMLLMLLLRMTNDKDKEQGSGLQCASVRCRCVSCL